MEKFPQPPACDRDDHGDGDGDGDGDDSFHHHLLVMDHDHDGLHHNLLFHRQGGAHHILPNKNKRPQYKALTAGLVELRGE